VTTKMDEPLDMADWAVRIYAAVLRLGRVVRDVRESSNFDVNTKEASNP